MNPERWEEVQKAYLNVVELTPEQRSTHLQTICAGDLALQREVESLLNCKNRLGGFLDETAIEVLIRGYGVPLQEPDSLSVPDLTGRVIDDRYIVSKHIGSGGMGDVYRAEHRLLGVPVAIKRLAADFRNRKDHLRRFVAEARRAVLLDHDNVAKVRDVVEESNEVFVIMEFIDGHTLRKSLDHAFTLDEFLPIATQCASALVAAHEQRIVHLDIKPENIMLTGSNKVKVCDFGVARQMPADDDNGQVEPALRWTFGGTPPYMAPEVLQSNRFDTRADIFSLGVVFYEMLAGEHPFRSEDVRSTTKRILTESAPLLSVVNKKLPVRLVRLIHKMLAKDPGERPGSVDEVFRELQNIRRQQRFFTDTWHSVAEMCASVTRKPVVAVASSVLLAVLIAVAIFYFKPLSRSVSLPEKKILVILPFRVIGNSGDERFYSEGVSAILTAKLTELSTIPNLQVAPTGAVRERKIDSLEKARGEFGATLILDGTFQFFGGQVRVSYALTDTASRRQVASSQKMVQIADPFKLQDGVIQDVLRMLQVKLSTPEQEAIAVYGTSDFKAFSLYTSGLGALSNYQEPENVEKAINVFSQAVEQDSNYALAYAALGRAYWIKFLRSKEIPWLDLSRTACDKAAGLDLQLSEAQVCLGRVTEEKGDYELAIEYYRRAVEYSPANDDGHRALGEVLERLNRFEEAEKAYVKATELRPQYWAGYSWRGGFYRRRNRYSEAIEQFYKALAVSPDNAQVCYSLALAYLDDLQYDNAIKTLQKAIVLGPYLEAPYGNLGLTYLRRGRYPEAVAPLEKAASLNQNYRSLGNLARIYWLVGRTEEARQKYELAIQNGEKLLQQNPRDFAIHLLVGRYYAMLGKKPEATSHIVQALSSHPDDPHYLMIAATAYVQLGDRNQALGLMEQAIRPSYGPGHIEEEPELGVLKTEPRYIALMSNAK
jgi:eukaryotic-like serine/threonine-protein kinase